MSVSMGVNVGLNADQVARLARGEEVFRAVLMMDGSTVMVRISGDELRPMTKVKHFDVIAEFAEQIAAALAADEAEEEAL